MFQAIYIMCALGANPGMGPKACPMSGSDNPPQQFETITECNAHMRKKVDGMHKEALAQGISVWGGCVNAEDFAEFKRMTTPAKERGIWM